MHEINLTTPTIVGENAIAVIRVHPLMFAEFTRMTQKAVSGIKDESKLQVALLRARIIKQCVFVSSGGQELRLTEEQLTTLPAPVARLIVPGLSKDEGSAGEVLSEGDGFSTAIHYKFGSPIKGSGNKSIKEVEFLAKTFGDVETVLASDGPMERTMALISSLARPVDGSMLALPSWALDQITLADGVFIMNKILPRFLD